MQVKVFESTDMASGLKKVRQELGPDALILSTRTIKNGTLGLLGKQVLEITAAIDSPWPSPKDAEKSRLPATPIGIKAYQQTSFDTHHEDKEHAFIGIGGPPVSQNTTVTNPLALEQPAPADNGHSIRHEVDELKSLVKNLAGDISRIRSNATSQPYKQPGIVPNLLEEKLRFSRSSHHIEDILRLNGVNSSTARTLSTFACDRLNETELQDQEMVYSFLRATIADILSVKPPVFARNAAQKRIALLGPTGVGKTTTLAKIAAQYLSKVSHSVALITIDTYRIAAVEQLKVYGEIMHLPVDVVISPHQLITAIHKHNDKDLILIDTAGRSPQDNFCIEELHTFLQPDLQIENHLVLSATTRDNELIETINKFSGIGITNIIFTKTDECSCLGVLMNVQLQNPYPLSYVTNGQRVPEDIAEADVQEIAKLILPSPSGKDHDKY
jgi:flagellar biosynthesis protein FlhF